MKSISQNNFQYFLMIVLKGRGFRAFYSSSSTACDVQNTVDSGTIHSPNYPASYDSSDDCQYTIQVTGLHDIELKFEDFSMPSSENCTQSYLAIYDGTSSSDPLIVRHCGSALPSPNIFRSTSNNVYMRMKADGRSVAKGIYLLIIHFNLH